MVEHLIGAALSLMLGLAAGVAVRRLEEAKGWDLAPFFRGAIVGSFVAVPIVFAALDQESLTIQTPATASPPWASSRPGSQSEGSSKHFGRDGSGKQEGDNGPRLDFDSRVFAERGRCARRSDDTEVDWLTTRDQYGVLGTRLLNPIEGCETLIPRASEAQ